MLNNSHKKRLHNHILKKKVCITTCHHLPSVNNLSKCIRRYVLKMYINTPKIIIQINAYNDLYLYFY